MDRGFPIIAKAAAKLPVATAWTDGEICVVDAQGRSSFHALQTSYRTAPARCCTSSFDLLYADGTFQPSRSPARLKVKCCAGRKF